MSPEEALIKLARVGYRFEVMGDRLRWRYQGQGRPNLEEWRPWLEVVKAYKDEAMFFLRCYCPKCGGVVFCPNDEGDSVCYLCDWLPNASRNQVTPPDRGGDIACCGECVHFQPSHVNPAQGWGLCGNFSESGRTGAYPGKIACRLFLSREESSDEPTSVSVA
jgi:hypothetical protein